MGFIYDKCRSLYYFLSPLARKQAKIERMIAALKIELCVTNQSVEALPNRLVNVLSYYTN